MNNLSGPASRRASSRHSNPTQAQNPVNQEADISAPRDLFELISPDLPSTKSEPLLYPIPNIQPINMIKLRNTGTIEGEWVIDSSMKIPSSVHGTSKHITRQSVELDSDDGEIVAKLYVAPTSMSSPVASWILRPKTVTVQLKTHDGGGNIRLTMLDARNEIQGRTARLRNCRPPIYIQCRPGVGGNVYISLPSSFRGSIDLGRPVTYVGEVIQPIVFEYSAAIKKQLSITTATDSRHEGFIGSPIKGGKDRLEVDCHGTIQIRYDFEEVGDPDEPRVECRNQ